MDYPCCCNHQYIFLKLIFGVALDAEIKQLLQLIMLTQIEKMGKGIVLT